MGATAGKEGVGSAFPDARRVDIDTRKSILAAAVKENDIPTIIKLVEDDEKFATAFSEHKANSWFPSLLHIAANTGNLTLTSALMNNGAYQDWFLNLKKSRNYEFCQGSTALHEAAKNRHYDIVATLLEYHADPNRRDIRGCTPLHCAVTNGKDYASIVQLLVQSGAGVNVRNNAGNTAAHLAVNLMDADMLSVLVSLGADVKLKNNREESVSFKALKLDYLAKAIASGQRLIDVQSNPALLAHFKKDVRFPTVIIDLISSYHIDPKWQKDLEILLTPFKGRSWKELEKKPKYFYYVDGTRSNGFSSGTSGSVTSESIAESLM